MKISATLSFAALVLVCSGALADDASVRPQALTQILSRYCVGCHNATDAEGDVRLDDFQAFPKTLSEGEYDFIVPGDAAASGIVSVMRGTADPKMPPDDEPQPTEAEIAAIEAWVNAGAMPPTGPLSEPTFPSLPPVPGSEKHIFAIDMHPDGDLVALAKFGRIDLVDASTFGVQRSINGLPGKVNAVRFSTDGAHVLSASGIAGLKGHVAVWDTATGTAVQSWEFSGDAAYAVDLSSDGKHVAAGGYDKIIRVWDRKGGKLLTKLVGHNGAIYGLRFDSSGEVLATASADETVKIWNVATSRRLDTLGQPLAEQYCVDFSSDGRNIIAAGADNRIRVWKLASKSKTRVSPLKVSRFAHERPIVAMDSSRDGRYLCTAAEDGTVKLWGGKYYRMLHQFPTLDSAPSGIVFSTDDKFVIAAMLSGEIERFDVPDVRVGPPSTETENESTHEVLDLASPSSKIEIVEHEPNNDLETAQVIEWPSIVSGVISIDPEGHGESDMFRFKATAGQRLQLEVDASRHKSSLDSKIDILDSKGHPVQRVQLQAVRDSYFTFRGKNGTQVNDFRVHNWQEMELNEYLYSSGEVVRLWLYPRGPDSGFTVYPGFGNRHTFFGTTGIAHALGEPAYIVRPVPAGHQTLPNGLPLFTVFYENDDDPLRRWGSDSRLEFTAPEDGEYLVRVRDARDYGGKNFTYRLTLRSPKPDFRVAIVERDLKVRHGAGAEFKVRATREDGFDGPIKIELENLPAGFSVTTPLWIEAGQQEAFGTVYASHNAVTPGKDSPPMRLVATAKIGTEQVEKSIGELGRIEISDEDAILVELVASDTADETAIGNDSPLELTIAPGETISAFIQLNRDKFAGRVEFGKEDAGRNLPHGVYIDNIGLNGLLIPEGKTRREFFITAAPWVPDTERQFHLRSTVKGRPTSQTVLLKVRR